MWKYLYFRGLKYNIKIKIQKNIMMKFHVKFHRKKTNLKKFSEKIFYEIPGGTSRYIHGIFCGYSRNFLLGKHWF